MANTICPFCNHDRAAVAIAQGAGIGGGIAVATLINPIVGGLAAACLAVYKLAKSDAKEIKCPKCGEMYPL